MLHRHASFASLLFACSCLTPAKIRADVCGKPSKDSWEGECLKSAVGGWGEPKGVGLYGLEDGTKHEMEWANGRPVGWGIFIWSNGMRYEGHWKDGQPHGAGNYTWRDGKRYEGDSVNGKQTGKGRFRWPDGESYSGDFFNGQEHGNGLFISADGSHYCGTFDQGKGRGHVVVRFRDGSAYQGQWNDSSLDGHGMSLSNGTVYEGLFKGALPWGSGVMLTAAGLQYAGEWAHGVRSGSGVYEWPDASSYRGAFAKGRQHGCGTQLSPALLFGYNRMYARWQEGQVVYDQPQVVGDDSPRHSEDAAALDPRAPPELHEDAIEVEERTGKAWVAAQTAQQEARRSRAEAVRIVRQIDECAHMHLSLADTDTALDRIHQQAEYAREHADKPQPAIAVLLGTLCALTLWMIYILVTEPKPIPPLPCKREAGASKKEPRGVGDPRQTSAEANQNIPAKRKPDTKKNK